MKTRRYPAKLDYSDRFNWWWAAPFIGIHIAVLGIFWTGFTTESVILCITLYALRVFALTGGYHRYFAHRSYKTGRVFQFILAFIGGASLQRGALWWAAKHREHHRFSDQPEDAHSPRQYGFWDSHVGWVFRDARQQADLDLIPEMTRYPELMWLNKYNTVPGILLGIASFLIAGWAGFFVGFILSTVLVYHVTFLVNSLAHVTGRQRYLTGDDSRNCWWIALLTFGEGWHNNHHYYAASARQGFRWYEIDISYMILRLLEKLGVVWDLQAPPEHVVSGERRPSRIVIEKTAGHLASSFSVDKLVEQIQQAWTQSEQSRQLEEFRQRARQAKDEAEAYFSEVELPSMPSIEDMRAKAHKMFARVPALDVVVERAREKLHSSVMLRLIEEMRLPQPAV